MSQDQTRRAFVKASSSGIAAITAGLPFMFGLPRVSADETTLKSNLVALNDGIEPLVQLIETSSRETLLERVAERIRAGSSYREVLAALFLAGIRNVQPRPAVGFKFHCVLVVNSCHLASVSGPDKDRWLPIFWALDYFKSSQASESKSSGWRMPSVNEALVPDALHSKSLFIEAMDNWDLEKADAATAGLARTTGATEVFNLFATYAARDYRSIGHKAIYLANAWRTLQIIGWQFAEPVLRSLTSALLNHSGESNPSTSDHKADRPWRENLELLDRIPPNWLSGKLDDGVPTRLFETFRHETPSAASKTAVDAIATGVAPQSVWDGVFVGAGELLMRQPGIIGLHGLTTANAMHYLWQNVADETLRKQLLLQACSFNPMFRESAESRGKLGEQLIDSLQPAVSRNADEALPDILSTISSDQKKAADKVFGFLAAGGRSHDFVDAARQTMFIKGNNAHDYKFSSAVLEDYEHVSAGWRDRFLATAVFNLKGSGHPDNGLVKRSRKAFNG